MKKTFSVVFVMLFGAFLMLLNTATNAAIVPVHDLLEKNKELLSKEAFISAFKENGRDDFEHWELPSVLKDVSGIKYLGDSRFACIQDKEGTIFIYNVDAGKIEKEIPFGGSGDFEGIAIAGSSAYVVQSNGKIYEVLNYEGAKPVVHQYTTPLTAKHNVEGLTYDKANNRLLLAIKGMEPKNKNFKGIYAFDLKSKQLAVKPVVKINLADPFFYSMKAKGTTNTFQPSAIEVHPITNDIYVLQGTDPKLLVMDAKGRIKKLYSFSCSEFPQAEGLAFSPKGELFISNEGTNDAATIIKVTL